VKSQIQFRNKPFWGGVGTCKFYDSRDGLGIDLAGSEVDRGSVRVSTIDKLPIDLHIESFRDLISVGLVLLIRRDQQNNKV
jgi:hypothetical protein